MLCNAVFSPQFAGAPRSTVNKSTGFTPNKIMIGREVNTPAYLMFPYNTGKTEIDTKDYVTRLVDSI